MAGLKVLINQVDYSDYLQGSGIDTNAIIGAERGKASFILNMVPIADSPATSMSVGIYDAGKNPSAPGTIDVWEFRGSILKVTNTDIGRVNGADVLTYRIDCSDGTDPFYQQYVTDSYVSKFTGFMLRDAIKKKAPQVDVTLIPDGVKEHPFFGVELEPLTKVIDTLCAAEGWQWYLDGDVMKIGEPSQDLYPLELTDANLHLFFGKNIEISPEDATQIRNVIYYEYMAKVVEGKAELTTDSVFVRHWEDDNSQAYNRYQVSTVWSDYEPGGVFYAPNISPIAGSAGRYQVSGVNTITGNLALSQAFQETAASGLIDNGVAPTYKTMRTKATTAEQEAAFDRVVAGSWIAVTTVAATSPDESRYIKSVVKSGTLPNIYYAFTFGTGNPTTVGVPSTSPDAPVTAAVPVPDTGGNVNYWSLLEDYVWTNVPHILKVVDTTSIAALKALLHDPNKSADHQDTGIREDRMQGAFVMTTQEAYDRAWATLTQYSNPLVTFSVTTTSWQLKNAGITEVPRPAQGVKCNLTSRGVRGVQTIKSVRKKYIPALEPDGTVLTQITMDFGDRLFYLHNVIRRIKEDLPRIFVDRRAIRDIIGVLENILGEDETSFLSSLSCTEDMEISDAVQIFSNVIQEAAQITDTVFVGVSIACTEQADLSDSVSFPMTSCEENYAFSDQVRFVTSEAGTEIAEACQVSDEVSFSHEHDGAFKYGYSKYGWATYW